MLILVSMRVVENATYPERRDAISRDWIRLFQKFEILPILVPNELDDPSPYFDLGAGGLLLTGGENLGPDVQPTPRDVTEDKLLAKAIAVGMPVLGTCRGLQMINRHFGGQVARKLPEPHVGVHDVKLSNGRGHKINSFHNEGVLLDGAASDLTVFASTKGGVVEGVRHRSLPITAIQWHPERPSPSADLDRELLQEWLAKCA